MQLVYRLPVSRTYGYNILGRIHSLQTLFYTCPRGLSSSCSVLLTHPLPLSHTSGALDMHFSAPLMHPGCKIFRENQIRYVVNNSSPMEEPAAKKKEDSKDVEKEEEQGKKEEEKSKNGESGEEEVAKKKEKKKNPGKLQAKLEKIETKMRNLEMKKEKIVNMIKEAEEN